MMSSQVVNCDKLIKIIVLPCLQDLNFLLHPTTPFALHVNDKHPHSYNCTKCQSNHPPPWILESTAPHHSPLPSTCMPLLPAIHLDNLGGTCSCNSAYFRSICPPLSTMNTTLIRLWNDYSCDTIEAVLCRCNATPSNLHMVATSSYTCKAHPTLLLLTSSTSFILESAEFAFTNPIAKQKTLMILLMAFIMCRWLMVVVSWCRLRSLFRCIIPCTRVPSSVFKKKFHKNPQATGLK